MLQTIKDSLESRNEVLFNKLVPTEGNCPTIEGEVLRAINRIIYRYHNDGDLYFKEYGCETAGPAHAFLYNHTPEKIKNEVLTALDNARINCLNETFDEKDEYDNNIFLALSLILDHIESLNENYTNNDANINMWRSIPHFHNYDEEECDDEEYCYFCGNEYCDEFCSE